MRDKNGQVLETEEDQHNRWAEHFREILNRPDPAEEATIKDTGFHIEMKCRGITKEEIEEAIRRMKGNRAPGEDRITADMLKANPIIRVRTLRKVFNQV